MASGHNFEVIFSSLEFKEVETVLQINLHLASLDAAPYGLGEKVKLVVIFSNDGLDF